MYRLLIIILLLISGISLSCRQKQIENQMDTEEFKLEKYLGTWYEIARFPHRFEKDLQGVTATYSLMKNGKVHVLNQGYKGSLDGKHSAAKGKAYVVSAKKTPRLKVSFFLFFYADYNILALDYDNYQWAMIGSSSPDYFWILCRQPQMDAEIFEMLKQKAIEMGYDLSKLQMVQQKAL